MKSRESLHEKLLEILDNDNLYFQPPESIKLKYPCIIYELSAIMTFNADDRKYIGTNAYELILITKNPEDKRIHNLLFDLPMISFNSFYTSDNLNHYRYTIYW